MYRRRRFRRPGLSSHQSVRPRPGAAIRADHCDRTGRVHIGPALYSDSQRQQYLFGRCGKRVAGGVRLRREHRRLLDRRSDTRRRLHDRNRFALRFRCTGTLGVCIDRERRHSPICTALQTEGRLLTTQNCGRRGGLTSSICRVCRSRYQHGLRPICGSKA